jgi:hypothetical protein
MGVWFGIRQELEHIGCLWGATGLYARHASAGKAFPTPNIPGSLSVGRTHICLGHSRMF